jgi:hypothetical protein
MSNKTLILTTAILIVILFIAGFIIYQTNGSAKNYDEFAQCLTQKGFKMYGAYYCTHCMDQKRMFGSSFKYINYIECPDNIAVCEAEKIEGYPTWKFGSTTLVGTQSLENLAQTSGCQLPQ